MDNDWKEYNLEECMDAIIDYRGKTPKKTKSGIPLITAKVIKKGTILPVSEYIAPEDYNSWMSRGLPKAGDIVMTTEAPLGEVAQLDNRKVALAQRVITLRGKKGILNNTFLKYLMISNDVQHQLQARATGTTVRGIKQKELRLITLTLPPITEQKAIAHILGSLDDKIELNRQMNETLEAMAQALFKSWFVDFDPVIDNALAAGKEIPPELAERAAIRETLGDECKRLPEELRSLFPAEFEQTEELGWIPKGWQATPLYGIAKFINGAAYRQFDFTTEHGALPVIKIAELKKGITSQTKLTKTELAAKYKIDNGDILFSWSGNPDTSIDTFVWTGGPGWLNQHIFKVDFNSEKDQKFVYYQLKYLRPTFAEIARNKQTTGLGHVTAQDMKRLSVIKCPDDILSNFNIQTDPVYNKWYTNLLSINNLSQLRDTLLPKLLSGEMRIPEAEKLVEEAL